MLRKRILTAVILTLMLSLTSVIRAQDDMPTIEIFMRLSVPEVGPPGDDWYWTELIREDIGVNVEVTFVASNEEVLPTLNTRAAANDLPDLFVAPERTLLFEFADQGLLADWDEFTEFMPTFTAERATDDIAIFGEVDGVRYGLAVRGAGPFERPTLAIRQDWLDAVGLEVPTTMEEMAEVMRAFTFDDPDGNGEQDTWGARPTFLESNISNPVQDLFFVYAAYGALGTWRIEDGTLEFIPMTDDRRAAVEYIRGLQEAEVLHPDWLGGGTEIGEAWKIGQIGVHNSDFCATFCPQGFGEFATANPDGILVPIDAPVGPDGESGTGAFSVGNNIYLMSARAAEEGRGEAVARFLEWLNTGGYLPTAYGLEGENWTRDANGRIVATGPEGEALVPEPFTQPDFQTQFQARTLAYKGGEEEYRVRYENIVVHPNGQEINPYQVLADNEGRPVNLTQFTLLPSAGQAGIEGVDLATYITTGELDFIVGNRPMDEWDDYVAGMENFGVQDWIDAANEAAIDLGLIEG